MEDRYLFKAKRVDNGKWVIGYYGVIGKRNVIIEKYAENYYCPDTCESRHGNQIHEVNSKTICQCTGLKDKNGKLIWENDIVKCLYDSYGENGVYIGKVIYREDTCCFVDANSESTDYEWWEEEKEVIGNIFDNKELLESEG
jgi:uncharacterized phage protein (TIGR01671 family)